MSPARDWQKAVVAPGGTHHLVDGAPLYAARFDEVLKFHAPGLAPVRDEEGAYHVGIDGRPVYHQRFARSFGFYEGLAAVDGGDGRWHHVRPDGEAAYAARWGWCGNFQDGRCAVRETDGRYLHIDHTGSPLYSPRWRYAGDFRDGIAVVQGDDGHSTHIDARGERMHGCWFDDLDVFHKGFARARDEGGWTHVDARGRPIYARRFAAVEPFYNGQARVAGFDGGLAVVDERGSTIVELRGPTEDALHVVSADLVSFWRCEAVFAAVELDVFDRLPFSDEEGDDRIRRLLAALRELGLVELTSSVWTATARGRILRTDHPQSLAAAAQYWSAAGRHPWRQLAAAIRDPAWRASDPFAEVAGNPASVAAFHSALTAYAEHDYAALSSAIDADHRSVLDAGGATGALARALLRARPGLSAVVFDRPEVVALSEVPPDLSDRLSFVEGDLFAPWPASADALILARILHDWDDERALAILRNAREAIHPGGRLYVVEFLRSPDGFGGALLSLHMLVSTGGRERTRAELERLFLLARLRLREVRRIPSVSSVLVVEAAA